jgi:hypothetical protein
MKSKNVKDVVQPKKLQIRSKSRGGIGSVKNVVQLRTKVNAMQCLHCGDIIYSCATHDFRSCTCGKCYIDGGFDYVRGGGTPNEFKFLKKYINATKKELYDDWNTLDKKRKYGCIKPKSSWKSPLLQSSLVF